jgi:hypothetical protein
LISFSLSLALAFSIFSSPAFSSGAVFLPDIPGWSAGEARTTQFDAKSGNYGFWQERDYRTPNGISLKAILTEGNGPKFYNQPPRGVSGDDLPVGDGASYEIVTIKGLKATVEKHPALGYSVAVNAFERKFTLTAETGPWHELSDVIECVENLLESMRVN